MEKLNKLTLLSKIIKQRRSGGLRCFYDWFAKSCAVSALFALFLRCFKSEIAQKISAGKLGFLRVCAIALFFL
jgi:hypothetical protein